ncbi:hypothetical protein LWI29_028778 [Acer saccharum]|uniref:MULE transposase domain-containing protein n=1 Tax=Acer saccharum TaxID=4024 RepID=A0AA39SNJ2_ACESA|nr:hypothetical protein LWI29_028778 [Acer saccharum]
MIYPLTFGFANSECTKSWTWFFKKLRKGIQNPDRVMLVLDRHNGIINAMEAIFLDAAHGICAYHLAQNLKRFCKQRNDVMWLYYYAAYSYRIEDFDRFMSELKETYPKVYDELLAVGVEKFSCVHCQVNEFLSSCGASFNADADADTTTTTATLCFSFLSLFLVCYCLGLRFHTEQSSCDDDEGNGDLLLLLPLTLGFLVAVVVTICIRTEQSFNFFSIVLVLWEMRG